MSEKIFDFYCDARIQVVGFLHTRQKKIFLVSEVVYQEYSLGISPYIHSGDFHVRMQWLEFINQKNRYVDRHLEYKFFKFSSLVKETENIILIEFTGVPIHFLFRSSIVNLRFANPTEFQVHSEKILHQIDKYTEQQLMKFLFWLHPEYGDISDPNDYAAAHDRHMNEFLDLATTLDHRYSRYPDFDTGFFYRLEHDFAVNEILVADVKISQVPHSGNLFNIDRMSIYTKLVDMPETEG